MQKHSKLKEKKYCETVFNMKIGINYSAIAFNMKAEKIKYKVFLFCLRKRCCRSRLTKGGSGSRLRPTISRLRSRPKSGGSKKRLRHRNTDKNRTNNYSPTKIRKYVYQKDYSATKLNKKIGIFFLAPFNMEL